MLAKPKPHISGEGWRDKMKISTGR